MTHCATLAGVPRNGWRWPPTSYLASRPPESRELAWYRPGVGESLADHASRRSRCSLPSMRLVSTGQTSSEATTKWSSRRMGRNFDLGILLCMGSFCDFLQTPVVGVARFRGTRYWVLRACRDDSNPPSSRSGADRLFLRGSDCAVTPAFLSLPPHPGSCLKPAAVPLCLSRFPTRSSAPHESDHLRLQSVEDLCLRLQGAQRHQSRHPPRRDLRAARPERRRQDDADQHHLRHRQSERAAR